MAEEKVVNLKINNNINDATESVKSLKAQLREAQSAVTSLSDKFGTTSDKAIEAAESAAILKDKIGDAKDLVTAFNPDAKFAAVSSSLVGVAGGFSAVTGAMGILGTESKGVEAAILKVQSAMAIASGLQAVGQSVDAFKTLGAVIRSTTVFQKLAAAAQYVWNAAMSANPIGAIVVAITALITAGYLLINMFIASSEANKSAAQQTAKHTLELEKNKKAVDEGSKKLSAYNKYQYELAKASGASAEELRKLAIKHKDEEIALNLKNTMLARSTFLRERDTLASMRANGVSDEVIKNQEKLTNDLYKEFTKQREGYTNSKLEKLEIVRSQSVEERQAITDANKKAQADEKIKKDKLKAEADARKETEFQDEKNAISDLLRTTKLGFEAQRNLVNNDGKLKIEDKKALIRQINNDEIKSIEDHNKVIADLEIKYALDAETREAVTEQQKLDLAKKRELEDITRITDNAGERFNLTNLLNAKYDALQLELDTQKQQDDLKKKEDANLLIANNQANDFAVRLAAVQAREDAEKNIIFKTQDEKTAYEAANADARKKIAEEEIKAKIALAQAAADSLGMLSEIAGKETAAGKALAIAQALINTYLGITAGVKLGFPAAIPAVLAASVTGFKAVKNIMAVQVPNSGGGGGAASATSAAPVSAAPQFNVVGTSGSLANQVQSVTKVQEPIKAYVVSKDVTSAQSLDRNIIKAATIA
jgi:hypothetical protein